MKKLNEARERVLCSKRVDESLRFISHWDDLGSPDHLLNMTIGLSSCIRFVDD